MKKGMKLVCMVLTLAMLLGLLAAGAALPATAASPLSAAAAITMPWTTVAVESIAPGDYAATMTVGTAQQLSPEILPEKAAKRANVSFVSDNPNIVSRRTAWPRPLALAPLTLPPRSATRAACTPSPPSRTPPWW